MESLDLQQQWDYLMIESGTSKPAAQYYFNDLCGAYCEAHRYYHTLDHIHQMLLWLHEAGVHDPAVLWATWYHDYVYNPGKKNNEARSAVKAKDVMLALGVTNIVEDVVVLIEATKNHQTVSGVNRDKLHAFLDADMAILGVPPAHYKEYSEAVRNEFKLVPKVFYQRGRNSFLKSILDQDRIFLSDWFYHQFEEQARNNIAAELSN